MESAVSENSKSIWSNGKSPFKSSYGKIMMWYFLIGDTFVFAAFLISYGALRFSVPSGAWPDPNTVFEAAPGGIHLPLLFVTIMTFILIASSVTMVRAVQEGHMMNRKGVVKWMIPTVIGGLVFLGCQAWEWSHLMHEGMYLNSNPFGHRAFGQYFFLITGFHGFHVLLGVVINTVVMMKAKAGVYDKRGSYEMVEKVGLYWHFVDLVWVFVFMCYYLL